MCGDRLYNRLCHIRIGGSGKRRMHVVDFVISESVDRVEGGCMWPILWY